MTNSYLVSVAATIGYEPLDVLPMNTSVTVLFAVELVSVITRVAPETGLPMGGEATISLRDNVPEAVANQ